MHPSLLNIHHVNQIQGLQPGTLFLTILIGILFGIVAGYVFAQFQKKQYQFDLKRLIRKIHQVQVSNLTEPIKDGHFDKRLSQLVEELNSMLERLESAFKVQKNFIDNSSHELRTPLTAITGQLEVTLMQDRNIEEYKTALASILEDIKSLNQLANRLLILSRAGSQFVADGFAHQRIDDILWKSRAEQQKLHPAFTINIHFDDTIAGEHHFSVFGNEQLLKTAFSNLIENGCKYSDNRKTEIHLGIKDNWLNIAFIDEGIGIHADEQELIFQPFYRGRNVKKERGHGIGLSLVEKIIELHEGKIQISSKPGKGSNFCLKLPLA